MNNNPRLVFADFAKLLAMFIVTFGHCAQCLSSQTFPSLFGKQGVFIAFHMPLFMMISGYFINPSKIRQKNWKIYVKEKFFRLVVPACIWYLLYSIINFQMPHFPAIFTFFWFLSSMFLSYVIFSIVVRINKKDHIGLYLLFLIVVTLLPFSSILHLNFMFPMIMTGYFLKIIIQYKSNAYLLYLALLLFFLSILLLFYWDVKYSVYINPYDSYNFSKHTFLILLIRLFTGFIISSFLIIFIKFIDKNSIIVFLAKYGRYTIVMYTASFIFNSLMNKFLRHFDVQITAVGLLEICSLVWCIIVCFLCIFLAKKIEKSEMLRKLLLGIYK